MHGNKELKPVIPSSEDKAIAFNSTQQLTKFLKSPKTNKGTVKVVAGLGKQSHIEVAVPMIALQLLAEVLSEMSKGNAITILPTHAELTTQEAAELLNVSRPFLIGLLDEGTLPFRKVGKHRRVLVQDVLSYRHQIDSSRRKVLDKLAEEAQELGLEY